MASRNLLDIDDLFEIVDTILRENLFPGQIVNVASPVSYKVPEIIKELESWQGRVANYVPIQKGNSFSIDISLIEPVISRLGLKFDEEYLRFLLKKYYQH